MVQGRKEEKVPGRGGRAMRVSQIMDFYCVAGIQGIMGELKARTMAGPIVPTGDFCGRWQICQQIDAVRGAKLGKEIFRAGFIV